jgi:DinB superfamily
MSSEKQYRDIGEELEDIRRRARELAGGLTAEQLARRPDPTAWSIAECLAHLNVTASVIQPKIASAIERGKKDKITRPGPFSPGAVGRLLIWIAEPPPKFRIRAPKNIAPQVGQDDPAQVVGEFMKVQDEWEKLIRDCDGLDQRKLKIASPFRGMPRLRLAAPIPWMMAHQRRHLLQAEKVKQQIVSAASPLQHTAP